MRSSTRDRAATSRGRADDRLLPPLPEPAATVAMVKLFSSMNTPIFPCAWLVSEISRRRDQGAPRNLAGHSLRVPTGRLFRPYSAFTWRRLCLPHRPTPTLHRPTSPPHPASLGTTSSRAMSCLLPGNSPKMSTILACMPSARGRSGVPRSLVVAATGRRATLVELASRSHGLICTAVWTGRCAVGTISPRAPASPNHAD